MILLKVNRQKDVVLLFFGHSGEGALPKPCPETSTAASQNLASVELLMKGMHKNQEIASLVLPIFPLTSQNLTVKNRR